VLTEPFFRGINQFSKFARRVESKFQNGVALDITLGKLDHQLSEDWKLSSLAKSNPKKFKKQFRKIIMLPVRYVRDEAIIAAAKA
jgi:hypothetical protein